MKFPLFYGLVCEDAKCKHRMSEHDDGKTEEDPAPCLVKNCGCKNFVFKNLKK